MKNIFRKLSGCFLAGVLVVGQMTANGSSILEFHQPKVPAELKR